MPRARIGTPSAVLALTEVETPYLAHHFYMPGIWKPVFVFIQHKFVTIYSKVCNNCVYTYIQWILCAKVLKIALPKMLFLCLF